MSSTQSAVPAFFGNERLKLQVGANAVLEVMLPSFRLGSKRVLEFRGSRGSK
jgi:hypothetical protein